jgi:hypothetical protein
MIPDRTALLREKLERGETITAADIEQVTQLQTLDVAAMDITFANDSIQRDREANERLLNSN